VDLCLVAEGAERQVETSWRLSEAICDLWPRPAFTRVPITPQRLAEKRARNDHFSTPCLRRESCLPRKTDSNNPADWIALAESELEGVRHLAQHQLSVAAILSVADAHVPARSKP
jgi:hypothetical protein